MHNGCHYKKLGIHMVYRHTSSELHSRTASNTTGADSSLIRGYVLTTFLLVLIFTMHLACCTNCGTRKGINLYAALAINVSKLSSDHFKTSPYLILQYLARAVYRFLGCAGTQLLQQTRALDYSSPG